MRPSTRYARSGDINIAYQVVGDGPPDVVYVPGWVSHLEYAWESPAYARFLERLSRFARLILLDKRGTGLSDRDVGFPTLEQRMDDVRAVMDAVGSQGAALFGTSEGGNMSALFAATYPERTSALILFGAFARRLWAVDYPWAPTPERRQTWLDQIERDWGGPVSIDTIAPSSAHDPGFRDWWSTYLRCSASPQAAVTLGCLNSQIDIRGVLPAIRVPCLILHRRGDRHIDIANAHYLARHVPEARLIELPGEDHVPWVGDQDAVIDEIELFLTGMQRSRAPDRILATILFTDIVDSTRVAAELGDQRWHAVLDRHHAMVRQQLARCRGREVKTLGDGFLAAFDGPARAIQCATAIRHDLRALGLDVRSALHTGECEVSGSDLAGIAVHIAARILDMARPGEVLVSRTVKDLVVGAGIDFQDQGERALKGLPDPWHLFAVDAD